MFQDGQPVVGTHVKDGNEGLGPLAGNALHARYEMERGMIAYFDSIANDGTQNHGFGLHLVGSKGILAIRNDRQPFAYWVPGNPLGPTRNPALHALHHRRPRKGGTESSSRAGCAFPRDPR